MKSDLHKTLDKSLEVKRLLQIKAKVLSNLLIEDKDWADEFHLYIGKILSLTNQELVLLDKIIDNTIADMSIFGDEGPEKQIEFHLFEGIQEEEEIPEIEWEELDEDDDYDPA